LVCSGFAPISFSAQTETGSKMFDCALMSTLETYDDPEKGSSFIAIICIMDIIGFKRDLS
jgi:hypothetical protein